MSTRKNPSPASASAVATAIPWLASSNGAGVFQALDGMADLPRQQAAVACEAACALFRGFEAIRTLQVQAAHQALVQHGAAAERLKKPLNAQDLAGVQLDLARFNMEAALQYWQALGAATVEMTTQMAGCATHLVDSAAVLEAAHSLDR